MKICLFIFFIFLAITGCQTDGYNGTVIAYVPIDKTESLRASWLKLRGIEGPRKRASAPNYLYYLTELKKSGEEASIIDGYELDNHLETGGYYSVSIFAEPPFDMDVQADVNELTNLIYDLIKNEVKNAKVTKSTGTYRRSFI